jgi:hypothetical protein
MGEGLPYRTSSSLPRSSSGAYPMGYDRITDGLSIFPGTSLHLEYLVRQTVGCTFTLAYFFSPTSPSAFL